MEPMKRVVLLLVDGLRPDVGESGPGPRRPARARRHGGPRRGSDARDHGLPLHHQRRLPAVPDRVHPGALQRPLHPLARSRGLYRPLVARSARRSGATAATRPAGSTATSRRASAPSSSWCPRASASSRPVAKGLTPARDPAQDRTPVLGRAGPLRRVAPALGRRGQPAPPPRRGRPAGASSSPSSRRWTGTPTRAPRTARRCCSALRRVDADRGAPARGSRRAGRAGSDPGAAGQRPRGRRRCIPTSTWPTGSGRRAYARSRTPSSGSGSRTPRSWSPAMARRWSMPGRVCRGPSAGPLPRLREARALASGHDVIGGAAGASRPWRCGGGGATGAGAGRRAVAGRGEAMIERPGRGDRVSHRLTGDPLEMGGDRHLTRAGLAGRHLGRAPIPTPASSCWTSSAPRAPAISRGGRAGGIRPSASASRCRSTRRDTAASSGPTCRCRSGPACRCPRDRCAPWISFRRCWSGSALPVPPGIDGQSVWSPGSVSAVAETR